MEISVKWNRWLWLESDLPEHFRNFFFLFTFFFAFASGDSPTHVFYRERKWNLFRLYHEFWSFFKIRRKEENFGRALGHAPDMSIHISSAEHQTKPSALILNETGWREATQGRMQSADGSRFFLSLSGVLYRRVYPAPPRKTFHPSILPFHVVYIEYIGESSTARARFTFLPSLLFYFTAIQFWETFFYLSILFYYWCGSIA